MTPRSTATGPRLRSLEALRGVLAVYVLVGHARWLLWAGHAAWLAQASAAWEWPLAYGSALFRFGREAVLVFFGLSGFFIHLSAALVSGRQPRALSAAAFYQRRAWRLMPPYLFALLITVICDAAGRHWFPMLYASATGDALLDETFARGGYDAAAVVPALAMLPSSLGHHFGSNGPLWSIAFEVIYYAVYPAWLWLRIKSGVLAMAALPAACFLVAAWWPVPFLSEVVVLYPLWILGAALAEFVTQSRRIPGIAATVLGTAGCAGYLAGPARLRLLFAALFVAAAVYLAATWRGSEDTAIHRLFQYLGRRSYSIYVVHFPFLALMSAMVFDARGARPMSGWLALGGAALALGLGCVCFWICERHFLRRRPLAAAQAV